MYSLFLLTSALSYLALLRATDRGGRRAWTLWGLAVIAAIATHTYGAIVLASQGLWVLIARPVPLRRAIRPFAVVALASIPFAYIDVVLAGRYDIGVGGGGSKLTGPADVLRYFFHAAGDFTARWLWVVWPVLAVAAFGAYRLTRSRRRSAILVATVLGTPVAIFLGARVGSSASPETRHVIFALPFFFALLATGLVALLRRPLPIAAAVLALVGAELAWTYHRTPELLRAEPATRSAARDAASGWLARTSRPDDVLLGYDPLFLGAWEAGGAVSRTVVPRADA